MLAWQSRSGYGRGFFCLMCAHCQHMFRDISVFMFSDICLCYGICCALFRNVHNCCILWRLLDVRDVFPIAFPALKSVCFGVRICLAACCFMRLPMQFYGPGNVTCRCPGCNAFFRMVPGAPSNICSHEVAAVHIPFTCIRSAPEKRVTFRLLAGIPRKPGNPCPAQVPGFSAEIPFTIRSFLDF